MQSFQLLTVRNVAPSGNHPLGETAGLWPRAEYSPHNTACVAWVRIPRAVPSAAVCVQVSTSVLQVSKVSQPQLSGQISECGRDFGLCNSHSSHLFPVLMHQETFRLDPHTHFFPTWPPISFLLRLPPLSALFRPWVLLMACARWLLLHVSWRLPAKLCCPA